MADVGKGTSSRAPTRIGLLGGSFDPLHVGHLVLAEQARIQLQLTRVVLIPSARPPHKTDRLLTDPRHRLHMAQLAAQDNPAFEASRLELDRAPRPSFTIDTLQHFFHQLHPHSELFFIMGLDSFLEISTWKDYQHFLNYSHLIVATRAGYDVERLEQDVPKQLRDRISTGFSSSPQEEHQVYLIEIPPLEISATDLRQRLRGGGSIRYLVSDPIWDYIQVQTLYR